MKKLITCESFNFKKIFQNLKDYINLDFKCIKLIILTSKNRKLKS